MCKCLICKKEFKNNRCLAGHMKKAHNITSREYKVKYNLLRLCKKCDTELGKKNRGGYCNKCRDRTGINNSFYGKSHSKETIEKLRKSSAISSKKMWENDEIRKRIINGCSKPRSEKFKKEQSVRIKQWYVDNPEQKDIRSKYMAKTWKDGKIKPNNFSCNKSKIENKLFLIIKEEFDDALNNFVIKYDKNKWMLPDIFIPSLNLIVEFNGNFWHANPRIYRSDDILHRNITAKEIWDKDKKRTSKLINLGYNIEIVWEDMFKDDNFYFLQTLNKIDWDGELL